MKNFLYLVCVLAICISPVAAQSFVTGVIPQYAGGLVTATTGSIIANASINAQGNFTIPVPSNPMQHVMTFTPPSNTPYQPFDLTVTAGPGTTNITAQIQAVVPQIGINLGILNAPSVATDSNGNAIPGNVSGGATFTPTGIQYATNTTSATVATPQQIATSTMDAVHQNQFFTNANPTGTSIVSNDVTMGWNAGRALAPGAGGVGGQADVFIGSMAGANATSMRESVVIGSNAASAITGNGTGPDDMIFVIIGSNAADGLTNLGGAGVIIGQKALESATSSIDDVVVGTHTAAQVITSINGTYVGASILNDCTVSTGTVVDMVDSTLIGTGAANNCIAASTITEATGVGRNSLDNLGTSTGVTAFGVNSGARNSTGSFNNFFGDLAGGDITSSSRITGSYNTLIAAETGSLLTSGTHNLLIDTPSGVATGSRNFVWSPNTGGNLSNGNDNIIMGFAAHQNAGDTNGDVAIGIASGLSSTYDNQVSIGTAACKSTSGARDLCIGFNTGQNMTGATDVTLVGDQAGQGLNGSEANDNAFGSSADFAAGVSNSIQIGAGTNAVSNTTQFYSHKIMDNATGTVYSEGNTVCESTGHNCLSGGIASSGYAFVPVTQTSVNVTDTTVTATNKIFLTADPSLSPGAVGSSCSSLSTYQSGAWVSARSPGTGFTVTVTVAAGTTGGGAACYSYLIVN